MPQFMLDSACYFCENNILNTTGTNAIAGRPIKMYISGSEALSVLNLSRFHSDVLMNIYKRVEMCFKICIHNPDWNR